MRFGIAALALAAAGAVSTANAAGILFEGGTKVQGSNQGNALFAAPGVFFEKPLGRRFDARAEVFPAQFYRERARPEREGPAGRVTVVASAACLMARYRFRDRDRSVFFTEGGAGPFYAYSRPVPSGGTRGNFFDQVGFGWKGDRLTALLRFAHVSNADIGPRRHRGNPGLSFATVGVAWSWR